MNSPARRGGNTVAVAPRTTECPELRAPLGAPREPGVGGTAHAAVWKVAGSSHAVTEARRVGRLQGPGSGRLRTSISTVDAGIGESVLRTRHLLARDGSDPILRGGCLPEGVHVAASEKTPRFCCWLRPNTSAARTRGHIHE